MDQINRIVNDIAHVRLVASRYRELQGLRTMADGGFLIIMGAGVSSRMTTGRDLALLVFALVAYGWFWWKWTHYEIGQFYSRRCGRVALKPWGPPVFLTTTIALQWGPICLDLGVARWVSVAAFAALLAARPAWFVVRDWPYRTLWLLPATAGMVAAVSFVSVVNRAQAHRWWGEFSLLFGASMLVAGWFDHRLLLKTLKPSDATMRQVTYEHSI